MKDNIFSSICTEDVKFATVSLKNDTARIFWDCLASLFLILKLYFSSMSTSLCENLLYIKML